MSAVQIETLLRYNVTSPCTFVFSILPENTARQVVEHEQLTLDPDLSREFLAFGPEGHRLLRVQVQPGPFTLQYEARVALTPTVTVPAAAETPYAELPPEVLYYLNPSRYCESDKLMRFAAHQFGGLEPGMSRVQAICDWIDDNVEYLAGSTDASSGTSEVLLQRAGVCRDFAHTAISLCRALGIPARYVSGYAVNLVPPDFHGFFEAWLAGEWYLFDATRMARLDGLVRIGVGRDAADVAFAAFVGGAALTEKRVSVGWVGGEPADLPAAIAGQRAYATA